MKNTLVIGDPHEPFCVKGYLEFCKRIYKAFNCKRVVCAGDLVDNHSISYHEHDPELWSPLKEMEETDKKLKKWFKAFPEVYLCRGNHDQLVDRKGKTVGLPKRCFKEYREIWSLPDGWVDDFEFIFDNVKYIHGTGYSGKYAHVQAAYDNRMSTVMGHLHAVAGVEYMANSNDIIFGMSVGCGIDTKALAFAYGKGFRRKPIVSCGVVSHTRRGTNATVYPMEMK
jgi:predicted phosphodiesterase